MSKTKSDRKESMYNLHAINHLMQNISKKLNCPKLIKSDFYLVGFGNKNRQNKIRPIGNFNQIVVINSAEYVLTCHYENNNNNTSRPLPITEKNIVHNQAEKWIQEGIIEPSESAYSSPIVRNGLPRLHKFLQNK